MCVPNSDGRGGVGAPFPTCTGHFNLLLWCSEFFLPLSTTIYENRPCLSVLSNMSEYFVINVAFNKLVLGAFIQPTGFYDGSEEAKPSSGRGSGAECPLPPPLHPSHPAPHPPPPSQGSCSSVLQPESSRNELVWENSLEPAILGQLLTTL